MRISTTRKLTFHEINAGSSSLKSLSHCICFARLIAARWYQAKQRQNRGSGQAPQRADCPGISIRNAAGAQRGRLSLRRLCARLSVCQSGQRVDFFARAGGAIVLNRTWWAQRVLVGQPSRPCRLCVFRACSGSRCSESGSRKGLMNIRGCKSTALLILPSPADWNEKKSEQPCRRPRGRGALMLATIGRSGMHRWW
jgi:hypothetical protein